jgi:hypothetical protein
MYSAHFCVQLEAELEEHCNLQVIPFKAAFWIYQNAFWIFSNSSKSYQ